MGRPKHFMPGAAGLSFSRFILFQKQESFANSKFSVAKIGQRELLFVKLTNSNFTIGAKLAVRFFLLRNSKYESKTTIEHDKLVFSTKSGNMA